MDIIQWYAVALAAIAALSIVFYVLGISISFLRTYATYHFLKHVFYARVHKYIRGTTRYHALLVVALPVGNVVCLMDDRTKILQRTGLLSMVNLVPLALGSHMNSIISCCGLAYNQLRPTAASLVASIASTSKEGEGNRAFCGICCVSCNDDFSNEIDELEDNVGTE
jgi:hypothetical protein